MDTNALGRALGTVGQNLGTVANYQASEQRFKDQQAIADRREQAANAFREHLTQLELDNRNAEHKGDMAQNEDHFSRSEAANRDRLTIEQQRADTADTRTQQQLGIEQERVSIERDRATTGKQDTADTRTANAIGGQLKSIASTVTGTRKQMQAEQANAMKAMDWALKTPEQQKATMNAISAKYQPILDSANQQYQRYSKKFAELTKVDPVSADLQAGGDETMGTGDDTGASTAGDASDNANVDTAPANAMPGTGAAPATTPYPEGTRLTGKDGKTYVVKGGVPVPE